MLKPPPSHVKRVALFALPLAAALAGGPGPTETPSAPPQAPSQPRPASPPPPAPAIQLKATPIETELEFPLFLTSPPGDTRRVFIVERAGRIRLRKDGILLKAPFLDISPLTGQGHEYGLYSMAFHPRFASNRRYFVYYLDNNADSRLVEFRAAPGLDQSEPMPVRTLLAIKQASYCLHYGGMIAFGPDGCLYVGMGDGQTGHKPSSPARDGDSLLGKMLRIDVDKSAPYAVPSDNPFVGKPGWREEIWMTGLRNPWRWSFDRMTGDLWVADVGEDKREEITFIPRAKQRGADLGWPVMEGTLCFRPRTGCDPSGLTPPVLEYDHPDGCSVTGGYVYRGERMPALKGTYFYADYCTGWVRSFRLGPDGRPIDHRTWDSFPKEDNPGSFGEDASGEIYLLMSSGKVYRIEPA